MTNLEEKPLSLLLVEDSPADVFLVREAMKAEGLPFQLEALEDGEKAFQKLARVDAALEPAPNVVMVDLSVPRRDGIEVLERIRSSPQCKDVPVIVVSSSDSPSERQRAFDVGATAYFRKPSSLDEFLHLGRIVHDVNRKRNAA